MKITPDIQAMIDVLADIDESTDGLGVEEAVQIREAIVALMSAARMTLALVDTQLVTTLEGPVEINGMRYEVKKSDGKWRPDHSKVNNVVKTRAYIDPDTGEVLGSSTAAERAIAMMEALYVSASTMPKVGALDKLGLKKWDVAEQEPGKPTLRTTPIVEAPE
jgi:hypothetical protein